MAKTRVALFPTEGEPVTPREARIRQRRNAFARQVMQLGSLSICVATSLVSLFLVLFLNEDPDQVLAVVVAATSYLIIPLLMRIGMPFATVKGLFFVLTLLIILLAAIQSQVGLTGGFIGYLPLVITIAGLVYRAEGVAFIVLCSTVVVAWVFYVDANRTPVALSIDTPTQAMRHAATHIVAIVFAAILVIGAMQIFDAMLQRMTEARDAARRAATAKSAFLATISHEVRTPLNGVIGMAEVLANSDLSPQQRAQVETISDAGKTLLALVNDLLDYSKIDAGELSITPEPVNIEALLHSAERLWAPNAAEKGLRFVLLCDDTLPVTLLLDPLRTRQCINNLIANAVKFTAQGTVSVEVRYDAPDLHVSVTDTGIGIGAEAAKRLFQPFEQGNAKLAIQHGGTGLGLAITRQLARRMGGDVTFDSREGVGSVFKMQINAPVFEAPAPLRALVIDDTATNAIIARSALTQAGIIVETVGSEAFLAEGPQAEYDLFLTDGDRSEARLKAIAKHIPEDRQMLCYCTDPTAFALPRATALPKPLSAETLHARFLNP